MKVFENITSVIFGNNGFVDPSILNKSNSNAQSDTQESSLTVRNSSDEWVEIYGYKRTDKNMKCLNDFQYELGKTYRVDDPSKVESCEYGFHLCQTIKECAMYYGDILRDRFFYVRAVVKKTDLKNYCNKIAAKEIELIKEISVEEIHSIYKKMCVSENGILKDLSLFIKFRFKTSEDIKDCLKLDGIERITNLGYSHTFATALMENVKFREDILINKYLFSYKRLESYSLEHFDKLYLKARALKEEGISSDMCAYLLLK